MDAAAMQALIRAAGREPRQRTTLYAQIAQPHATAAPLRQDAAACVA